MVSNEFAQDSFPLVVAHRGASSDHPENTLESFAAALDAGADVVELDVRVTADGVPVVMHDGDVSRSTGGRGFVHEMKLSEIKRLDASMGRGSGIEVPTVAEVLDLVSGRAGVNFEIKNIPGDPGFDGSRQSAVEAALRELARSSFSGPVLVSSFNWTSIERSRDLAPDVPTGFLTVGAHNPFAALSYARDKGHAWILPERSAVLEAASELLRRAHEEGVLVGTWVVDDPHAQERLFEWGIDAVAANDPAQAVETRNRFRKGRAISG